MKFELCSISVHKVILEFSMCINYISYQYTKIRGKIAYSLYEVNLVFNISLCENFERKYNEFGIQNLHISYLAI